MTQLCLTMPAAGVLDDAGGLTAALSAAAVAAVVVTPPEDGELTAANTAPIVAAVQAAGAAALLFADARLARVLKADGVHLPALGDAARTYEDAREILGRGAIVGVDAGRSRHDAMTVGELGCDYVAFGSGGMGTEERLNLVSWWAEIFEIPVVAFGVATPAEAAELTQANADFVSTEASACSADLPSLLAGFVGALASPRAVA